ncbi:uncharacterized protein LOC144148972 isoform X1 [Haemaphysalis longicornis]
MFPCRQKNCEGREKISEGRHHSSSCRKGPRPCSSFKEEGRAIGGRDAGAAITQHGVAGNEKSGHGLQLPASMSPAEPPAPDTSCASTSLAALPARALYGAGCEENEGLRTRGHEQVTHAASEISSTRVRGSAPIRRFLLALPPSEGLRAS